LTALAASTAASFGEEILFRLFLVSLLLNILPRKRVGTGIAIVASAILFGAAHAPALVYLFGGLDEVPPIAWAWLIGLNGVVGVLFGAMFVRYGIGCAILAHFGTDLVWHVASQLGS
jgi:membrane protease YdiL (CAAX protease family)